MSLYAEFSTLHWQQMIYRPPGNVWGDWSWKPARDAALGHGSKSTFETYKPAPFNGSELAANARHSRGLCA